MRELTYTLLELEDWNRTASCYFCSKFENENNKAICQIRTRNKASGEIITNACACQSCKEKFENDELPKCERCGRLQVTSRIDIISGKYICDCTRNNENLEEKELPALPERESMSAFYERQINNLREDLDTAEIKIDTHLEALEIAEDWHKEQKRELLDRIKGLEVEVERLKKQTPQELVEEIESYKKEVIQLKTQLEKLNSRQSAQIEVIK